MAPATSDASSPTTSALMWKSGSELKPRSVAESWWWRATARAVWSSWRSVSRISLGVPVVPDVERTSPPSVGRSETTGPPGAPSGESASGRSKEPRRRTTQSVGTPAGPGRSLSTTAGSTRPHTAASSASGAPGSSGAATRPAATTPRKTIEKSTASVTAMPTVSPEPMPRSSSSPAHRVVARRRSPNVTDRPVRTCSTYGWAAPVSDRNQMSSASWVPSGVDQPAVGGSRSGTNGSRANGTVQYIILGSR